MDVLLFFDAAMDALLFLDELFKEDELFMSVSK
jgi:hypothetical protein